MKLASTDSNNCKNVNGIIIGFIILITAYIGSNFLFLSIYKLVLDKSLRPIIFLLFILISMILVACFLYSYYNWRPLLFKESFLNSVKVAIGGIILLWFSKFFEYLFFLDKGITDPFFKQLIELPMPFYLVGILLSAGLSPLFEEILMRGYIFEILRRKWNIGLALLLTLVCTFIMHLKYGLSLGMLVLFIDNIIYSFAYIEGGLFASIAGHAFVNFYLIYILK